ncbi:MAG: D-tyrosyl-tRNA(Tyr) deacylase [Ruminococcaceae bacterium]|nr:D-tyrosyl-tRNA(Tyr) deacylase [Oscillospiraceae bacterium]
MKAVLQRVKNASVKVDGETVGACGEGLMILLGVAKGDCEEDAQLLATKICNLRIFTDENDKMNLSIKNIDGEALIISQFTLMANYKHGNRPDYLESAPPDEANRLYEYFVSLISAELKHVGKGVFGAHMEVGLINDGPVTIVMDSEVLKKKKQ